MLSKHLNLPSVLIAPEANWAIINIHALNVGSPTSDLLEFRVRKEMWRAFAYASGCADSNDGRSIVQKVSSLADLDSIKVQNLDPIQMQGLIHNLRLIGITPKHVAPYKTACLRGWAPAPTNEYQKAIWDKVHAAPKNPMKIEFDPKKGR